MIGMSPEVAAYAAQQDREHRKTRTRKARGLFISLAIGAGCYLGMAALMWLAIRGLR